MKGFEETHSETDADRRHAERAAQIPEHLSDQCSELLVFDTTHDCGFSPEKVTGRQAAADC
jgi:hypothetical protein